MQRKSSVYTVTKSTENRRFAVLDHSTFLPFAVVVRIVLVLLLRYRVAATVLDKIPNWMYLVKTLQYVQLVRELSTSPSFV